MKKLLLAVAVLAIVITACKKDNDSEPMNDSSLLIGNWEATSVLVEYEFGTLNLADTTIRIVEEEGTDDYDLPSGTMSLNFTQESVNLTSVDGNVNGDWEYADEALYITWYMVEDGEEIEVLEILNVDELSSSSMVLSVEYYGSYPEDGEIYYEEYNQIIHFDKADSAQEIINEVERLITNNKTSISQLIKDLRNR